MIGGLNKAARYRAILQRERKYDGVFFFAVKGTGVYCRPSCPLDHSPPKDYAFFATIEDARRQNYRSCAVCRPDRLQNKLSATVLSGINDGSMNEKGVQGFAESLHISERHLRRIVRSRTGISPTALNSARRLEAAKALLIQTNLPITDVAFRAEFASLRQFNHAFKKAFKISPRQMRKTSSRVGSRKTNKITQDRT